MKIKKLFFILFLVLIAIIGFVSWTLFTSSGGKFATNRAMDLYANSDDTGYQALTGNLSEGVHLNSIELNNLKGFPEGSSLKVQSLFFRLSSFNILHGVTLKIDNARLLLAGSEPILVFGSFDKGILDFNFYSRGFFLNELADYFKDIKKVGLSGAVDEMDIYIKGSFDEPQIEGSFIIENALYQNIVLSNCPGKIDLKVKDLLGKIKPFGKIIIESGRIRGPRTTVQIEESQILFSGDFENPGFRLFGRATVENVKIKVALTGTLKIPDLKLSSEPSLPKEQLMVMLATGKRWKGLEGSIGKGQVSDGVTKDFVDYILFAQGSDALASYFGISDFAVTYEKDKKGFEAKKNLSDKWTAGYGIEQQTGQEENTVLKQKVLGEYKITQEFSVGAEKELKGKEASENSTGGNNQSGVDDKVYLKYKKDF
ncbi:MAG: translocation/assembly module TamB domain-containing protein [Candidatus Aceula meridiana]|nr:translocation/assembly module TamB domain-containing protein [Candidatus Aceula meridiana]